MPRLIAFATCFFWMAVHLLAALAALRMVPAGFLGIVPFDPQGPVGAMGDVFFATACGAVAAGFLWAFVVIAMDDGEAAGEAGLAPVNAAFAGAILLCAASLLALPVIVDGTVVRVLVTNVAALGASYAAVHAESAGLRAFGRAQHDDVAQRMAVSAAHDSMLVALSGRTGPGKERS